MKLSGAQAIIKVLLEQGVDTVFGYPGGQVIPLYNALYDAPLRNVLTAHEQGAIHAADGYARASGRTGVCIATSGPGATNICCRRCGRHFTWHRKVVRDRCWWMFPAICRSEMWSGWKRSH